MAEGRARASKPRSPTGSPLAREIGERLRAERTRQGLTQAALAGERYTKAYVSALENGQAKPSMAALHYLAERLGVPITTFLANDRLPWTRLEVDLKLASGDWQAAFDGYTDLLEAAEGPDGPERAELLRGLAEAAARLDRGEAAVRSGSEAASLFERRGRHEDAARARYWAAFGLYELEQSAEAQRLLTAILDQIAAGTVQDPDLNTRTLIALAMVASRDDQPEQALGYLEQARALVAGLDDRRQAAFLFSLALSYRELGDLEAAVATGNRSLAHFKAAEADAEAASLENELALVYLALGQVKRSRTFAAAARATFERLHDERLLAHVTETEAQIELAAGAPANALERAEAALRMARTTSNRKAELSALLSIAKARAALGDPAATMAALELAASIARESGRRGQLQEVLGELARVVADQGDLKRAFSISQEALAAGRDRR
jgi:transcriptional regulator with XRE-family HTH domain